MQCVQSHRADVVSSSSSRPRPLSEMFMSNGDMPTAADVSTSTSKQPFNSDSVSTDNAVGLACVYLFIPGAALWTFPRRCTVDIPPAVHCGHGCTVDISPEVHCGHFPGGALWTFPPAVHCGHFPGSALWTFPRRCTVDIPPEVHCGHSPGGALWTFPRRCTVDISPEVHCGHFPGAALWTFPGGALWTFPRLGMFKRDNLLASCDMSAYSQFVSQVLRCTACQLCWCCCLSVNAATTNIFY